MPIIRIRDLQTESSPSVDSYIPIDNDHYLDSAKKLTLLSFNNYISAVTYTIISGMTFSGGTGSSGSSGTSGTGSSGDTIEGFWFDEQTGNLTIETDKGWWITQANPLYRTGTTALQHNNILVYSAVTVNDGFWYPTGITFGGSGSSGSSGTNGTSGSSGSSGLLPAIGNNYELLWRDSGATYGYNTASNLNWNDSENRLVLEDNLNLSGKTLFSTDHMSLSQLEGGAYFGRVGLTENQLYLSEVGLNWIQTNSISANWIGLAISSDGKYQTVGRDGSYLYYSSDYGMSWTQSNSITGGWYAIAMSSDGRVQSACKFGSYIYNSYDYGKTWTASNSIACNWYDIAMSSDGKIQIAGNSNSGFIYVSYDYGKNWVQPDSPIKTWYGVACSSDGKIQNGIAYNNYIYYSLDYGVSWAQSNSLSKNWRAISMSSDGKFVTAVDFNGYIYISSDYGVNWLQSNSISASWKSVSLTSNGKYQIAGIQSGNIYYSSDYGLNWTQSNSQSFSDYTIATSSDGKVQTASIYGGYIYVSYATSNSRGNINVIGNVDTNYLKFNTGVTISGFEAGKMFYDNSNKTVSVMIDGDVTLQLGEEDIILVYNNLNSNILNGQLVYFTGSINDLPTVALAKADNSITSVVAGMATQDILSGATGLVTCRGLVHDVNTSAYTEGQMLYLSDTVAGAYDTMSNISISSRLNHIGFVVTTGITNGSIYMSIKNEDVNNSLTDSEISILGGNNASTGIYSFSGLTLSGTTNFNVGAASGWIVDNVTDPLNPSVLRVVYTGQTYLSTPYLLTNPNTHVMLNSGGTITLLSDRPTGEQRRRMILLGKIAHPSFSFIQNVVNYPDIDLSPLSNFRDMFNSIPLINNGIYVSAANTGLTIKTTAGSLDGLGINYITNPWDPNHIIFNALDPVTFQYRTSTSTGSTNTTTIDASNYDVGGVITSIGGSANSSTNQRIYLFPSGNIRIQYGQTVYSNIANAVDGALTETFTLNIALREAILIGILSLWKSASDLSNSNHAVFHPVSKFGEPTSGSLGVSTATLQTAYNNSVPPQIVTNTANDGVIFKRGSASDSDNVLVVQDGSSSNKAFIDGTGKLTVQTLVMSGITQQTGLTNYIVMDATGKTYYQSIWGSVPISSTSGGLSGQMAYDSNYLYVCISTNNWIRISGTTF